MKSVYILYEERESSQLCSIKGVWVSKEQAKQHLQAEINANPLYSDDSRIDLENGHSQSDPNYNEDSYSDYCIQSFEI